jgi:hypothetical protein
MSVGSGAVVAVGVGAAPEGSGVAVLVADGVGSPVASGAHAVKPPESRIAASAQEARRRRASERARGGRSRATGRV